MILIGLGNPGKKYEATRHNTGHLLIDFLNNDPKLKTKKFQLMKTDCFMNLSGRFVKKLLTNNQQLSTSNLYIAHDDLDLPLGKFKISFARGPKIHNGIISVEDELDTADFWRIRIGIDSRMNPNALHEVGQTNEPLPTNNQPSSKISGEEYVLSDFAEKERSLLTQTFGTIAETISKL